MKGKSRKFRKFVLISGRERLLFLEALFIQLYAGLLLKVVPFRWIPRLFSNRVHGSMNREFGRGRARPGTRTSTEVGHSPEPAVLILIKAALQRSAPFSPWKNGCLVQSLAARIMLNRRLISSQFSLGVAREVTGKTVAHAWLEASGNEVVEKRGDYTELFRF